MGLFDKKYCDICGAQIGLFGNRKLENGNCCKDCVKKLSPWFSDRRSSTVEDIKRQIAYREQNQRELENFSYSEKIECPGTMKILIDRPGARFVATRSDDLSGNPDIIPLRAVKDVIIEVTEDADEVMDKNAEGKEVSFDPPRFEYEYAFKCRILVDVEWFDDISFEVSSIGNRPTDHNGEEYQECRRVCHQIRCALLPGRFTPGVMAPFNVDECTCVDGEVNPVTAGTQPAADSWKCPKCGAEATGKFCNGCGTARPEPAEETWKCPNCGAEATGKFCNNCGTPKPEEWICPKCGNKAKGKFCNNCGTAKPDTWFCPNCGSKAEGTICIKCGTKRPV